MTKKKIRTKSNKQKINIKHTDLSGPYTACLMPVKGSVYFIFGVRSKGKVEIIDKWRIKAGILSDEKGREDFISAVVKEIAKLDENIGGKFITIKIILADPDTAFSAIKITKNSVKWKKALMLKSAEKLNAAFPDITAKYFTTRTNGDLTGFCLSINNEIKSTVLSGFNETKNMPSELSPALIPVFNRFEEAVSGINGGLLISENDYWTFILFSPNGIIRVISKWHSKTKRIAETASEVERKLRAYSASFKNLKLEKIFVLAHNNELKQVVKVIGSRFACPVAELKLYSEPDGFIPLSLYAAMEE